MVVVRDADDIALGFQRKADAERVYKELSERLGKFGLELHPDKFVRGREPQAPRSGKACNVRFWA